MIQRVTPPDRQLMDAAAATAAGINADNVEGSSTPRTRFGKKKDKKNKNYDIAF